MWMLLVLLYGVLKGVREVVKKKALTKNTVMEVLFFYTLLAFLFVVPDAKNAMGMEPKYYFYVALKSSVIFLAWIFSFKAIDKMPISIYGILDLSRVLFATLLGVFVLQEVLGVYQMIGLILVSAGLILLKFRPGTARNRQKEDIQVVYVLFAFASCILNAVSGLMDKLLMREISSSQLQFWYMLFLVIYYSLYILIKREKISFSILKNGWMWGMAVMFVIGDKALFIANGMEGSRITIMTIVKQFGCIITIFGGKIFFNEKNTSYRLFCALVIIMGILFGILFS